MYFTNVFPFFAFKNRDRVTIIADILKLISQNGKGKRKTNIMQSANLNHALVNKYLDLLMRNGYVVLDNGCMYKPTSRGLRFLHNLETDILRLRHRI